MPPLAWVVVVSGLSIAVAVLRASRRGVSPDRHDATWLYIGSILLLFAVVFGALLGEINYATLMEPYYTTNNLATYTDVDPAQRRGQVWASWT
jgi:uncharacterized membrane protein